NLVHRSMVQADESERQVRYRLLETIRQLARDRLIDAREAASVRARHLEYYRAWLRDLDPTRLGHDEQRSQIIDDNYDNLREALAWAAEAPREVEAGLWMVGSLWPYWMVRGRYAEGRRWAEALLDVA